VRRLIVSPTGALAWTVSDNAGGGVVEVADAMGRRIVSTDNAEAGTLAEDANTLFWKQQGQAFATSLSGRPVYKRRGSDGGCSAPEKGVRY